MKLDKAIKNCRQAQNLTQRELSQKTGISTSYLSLIEQGKRDPNISVLEKIVNALNIPLCLLTFIATVFFEFFSFTSFFNFMHMIKYHI